MSFFETELKKGRFVVSECTKCHKVTWPPNDFCRFCFGDISWRDVKEPGILVEYSAKNGQRFCIAEFEEIVRIVGTIPEDTGLKPGKKIRIAKCGFDSTPQFVFSAY
jgi:uncharacterized OB-fold protein